MPTGLRGTGLLASGRLERWAVLRGGCSVGHGVTARRDNAILEMVAGDNDRFPPIKFRNGEIARLAAVGVRRALFVDDILVYFEYIFCYPKYDGNKINFTSFQAIN